MWKKDWREITNPSFQPCALKCKGWGKVDLSTDLLGLTHLSREQGVGIELLQPQHQLIVGVDDIFHKAAIECKPIGAARDLQALWNAALSETPHVVVTLVEEAIKALLLNKPSTHSTHEINVWRVAPFSINHRIEHLLGCCHYFE